MNKVSKFFQFFFIISFLTFHIESIYSQVSDLDLDELNDYIEKSYQNWEIPGMAISIVKDGEVLFSKGYGIKEFGKEDAVDKNTLFAIASNTKAFTSGALSILVEEGKIDWDDKVVDYLPYFQLYDEYVTKQMTIRDLLCHRSGLETFSGDLLWYGTSYTREEIIERAKYLEPVYGFRSHYGYSNIMFLAAGQIIEVVTGIKWEDYIQEKFLTPLKMTSTYTSINQFKYKSEIKKEYIKKSDNITSTIFEYDENIAMPHEVKLGENPIVLNYLSWDNIAPAGALISSVSDMSNWLIMQLNNGIFEGDTILSEEQIWEMRSPQTIENIASWSPKYWPSKHFEAYGLGWSMFDYHGKKIINHGGGADGMISITVLVPEENLGFVILTNSINYLPNALMYYILDLYVAENETDWSEFYLNFFRYGQKEDENNAIEDEKNREKNTKTSLDLKDYCGTYSGDLYGDAKIKLENGNLVMYFIPTPMFIGDLTHWENDTFKIVLRNIYNLPYGKVNFIIEDDKVVELKVDIPNPDFDFTELQFLKQ